MTFTERLEALAEIAREAKGMTPTQAQIEARTASFRVLHETPGHVIYGVWLNGGKCGDLTVRQSERVVFQIMMKRGGFEQKS
jgi:hypothetical protein